jgi:hypothetical protein
MDTLILRDFKRFSLLPRRNAANRLPFGTLGGNSLLTSSHAHRFIATIRTLTAR